jgi:hypothetical protein
MGDLPDVTEEEWGKRYVMEGKMPGEGGREMEGGVEEEEDYARAARCIVEDGRNGEGSEESPEVHERGG